MTIPAIHRRSQAVLLCLAFALSAASSQAIDVSLSVSVNREGGKPHNSKGNSADVVVWLTPTQKDLHLTEPRPAQQYTLVQKDKQFHPHVLVVPLGSSVDFPNLDPFFHNVFSLFNGKRFDLGLYETHTHRAVRFDREGVSFIFCNIHPEMGAVVIALSTPYYGISAPDGSIVIHNVQPGTYKLNVWAENANVDSLHAQSRTVAITPENRQLGTLTLQTSGNMMSNHKNKFGESYNPPHQDQY